MTTKTLLLLALTAFGFVPSASAQTKAPPAKEEAKPIIVKMQMLPSRHFLVKVKIEGKGPYNLILDTGAPLTIITTRLAKDVGLIKKNAPSGFSLFGGVNQITIDKLEVGELVTAKTNAVVMDHPTVDAISNAFLKEHGPIDGIVGFPFFARYAMTVDYQKKELSFTPNNYKPGDYMADMMKNLMSATENKGPRSLTAGGLWGIGIDKEKDDEKAGVTVYKVFEMSAAAKGGIKEGDRILTIDGRWTDTLADAFLATSLVKAGKSVPVVVQRDGKEQKLMVTPTPGR